MRWLWRILGTLVALILAVFIIGATLPQKHSVSRSATVPATQAAVWAMLSDHSQDAMWRPDVETVRRIADRDGHPVWQENYKNGDSMNIETTLIEPQRKMVRRIVDESMFSGVWTYELAPSSDGKSTTVKITEDGEVYNPAFRFIGRFIIGNEATVEKYLRNLSAKLGGKTNF